MSYAAFNEKWQEQIKTGTPNLRKALLATYGRPLMIAGLFKLLWSVCVIMGAFFFVRTLQFNVNDHWYWGEEWRGWVLTAFYFLDAYILGGCFRIHNKAMHA